MRSGRESSETAASHGGYTYLLCLAVLVGFGFAEARPVEAQMAAAGAADQLSDTADVLQPGDLIRLRIWREPDFSGDFTVDETGVAILPRLGAVDVKEESPEALKARLVSAYRVFLTHSSVEVDFLRRVQITGAVQKPGFYLVEPLMTVADALALAGGVQASGREDKVEVLRHGARLPGTISGRMLISQSPVRSGDQLYVPQRSWLTRNTGLILGGISAASAVLYLVVH